MIKYNARPARRLSIRQRRARSEGIRTAVFSIVATVVGLPLALIIGVAMGEGLAGNTYLSDALMSAARAAPAAQYALVATAHDGNAYEVDGDMPEAECRELVATVSEVEILPEVWVDAAEYALSCKIQ